MTSFSVAHTLNRFQNIFQGCLPANTVNRVLTAVTSGVASIGVKQVLNIVFIPVIISQLGFEAFSLFMLMVGLQEISLFLDCGLSQTMITMASKRFGTDLKDSETEASVFYAVAYGFYTVAAILLAIVALSIAPFLNQLFHIPQYLHYVSEPVFILMMLEAVLFLLVTFYRSVLMSTCHHAVNNVADTAYHLLAFGAGIALLMLGYGLEGLMAARVVAALMRWMVTSHWAKKQMPKRIFIHALIKPSECLSEAKKFIALGRYAVVNNISIVLSHKVDTVVIGLFLPLSAVGVYEIVFRLLGSAQQLCIKMSEVILTLFASSSKDGNNEASKLLFLKNSSFNQMIIATLVILIVAFYPALLSYLTKNTLTVADTWMVLALVIPIVWSAVLQIPASSYLFTSGHENYLAKSSIATALCNLSLSLLLVKPLGLIGVILGTFLPQLIQHQYFLIAHSCKALNINAVEYLAEVYWRGLAPVFFSGMLLFTFLMMDLGHASLVSMALVSTVFAGINLMLWMSWRLETLESILISVEVNMGQLNKIRHQIEPAVIGETVSNWAKYNLKKAGVS